MIWLITTLLKWLSGGVLDSALRYLERRAASDTERDRISADVVRTYIEAELKTRQAARDIVIAEQGWWVTALIRPAFAYPLAIYYAAVIADSLFRFEWNVAALPAPIDEWSGWIITAYFLVRGFEKTARIFSARR